MLLAKTLYYVIIQDSYYIINARQVHNYYVRFVFLAYTDRVHITF